MKKYFVEIDIIKGIAIGLVLLGHSIITFPINLNNIPWCGFIHRFVSSVHMPMFFAVSGFCFSFSNWKDYLYKKNRRILIPYIAFYLLGVIPDILFPSLVNKPEPFWTNMKGFLTGNRIWFLYVLMFIFLVFPFYARIKNDRIRQLILVILITNYIFVPYENWTKGFYALAYLMKYVVYFTIGYLIRCHWTSISERIQLNRFSNRAGCCIGFIAWLGTATVKILGSNSMPVWVDKAYSLVVASIGIVFFVILANYLSQKHERVGEVISEYGKVSLQLYLLNGYFLTLGRTITVKILHISNPVIIILFNFVLMYFVSFYLIKHIIKKIQVLRIFFGFV